MNIIEKTESELINLLANIMIEERKFDTDYMDIAESYLDKNNLIYPLIEIKIIIRKAKQRALSAIGESYGYSPQDFFDGIVGFDTCGRSIRRHTRKPEDIEKMASFDAGRKFAVDNNIKV